MSTQNNAIVRYATAMTGFVGGNASLRITSPFGVHRGENRYHRGVDIGIPSGTTLMSAFDGTVVAVNTQLVTKTVKNAYGLYICVESEASDGSKFWTIYAHLHAVKEGIVAGTVVKAGTVIGSTGGLPTDTPNCGSSSGAHLHLEIRCKANNRDRAVDPMCRFLAKHTLFSSGVQIQAFSPIDSFAATDIRTLAMAKNGTQGGGIGVDENATEPKEVTSIKTVASDRLAPGIWQITKLLMDSSVENKQVMDSSISVQTGSLLNFFNKICQQPLVEFMGDTYGSQYYFVVRRPPTDRRGIGRLIKDTVTEIAEKDVMNTALDWNRSGIYSWFQYLPQGDVLGRGELQYMIPAVLFPEYAQLWGSKPLIIRSNYFNLEQAGFFNSDNSAELKENCNRVMRVMMEDFKFLVESNAYNPFVRRGTITIRGNRRIKRGTAVLLASTNEIFHVDAVSHVFNVSGSGISRTTTLSVSRGMFRPYIEGITIDGKRYSYFDIIDFGTENIERITQDNFKETLSKWHVDWEVFAFFLQKQAAVENRSDAGAQILDLGKINQ